jgi:hypothetical protein
MEMYYETINFVKVAGTFYSLSCTDVILLLETGIEMFINHDEPSF